ncbi:glycoside hydrolase family 43 protein [Aulographum hederae CBS 113979]|uniref:Endo-1,5-alpha-L-arabinanase A n=1 Tax=Aulographum hederae CBS 113979 TaxID=1176131 RepID=A0A6G1HBN4_9PEZI|nr:glycoside hydrolase family 43 protein [Aulographum hederae CBS 113979]
MAYQNKSKGILFMVEYLRCLRDIPQSNPLDEPLAEIARHSLLRTNPRNHCGSPRQSIYSYTGRRDLLPVPRYNPVIFPVCGLKTLSLLVLWAPQPVQDSDIMMFSTTSTFVSTTSSRTTLGLVTLLQPLIFLLTFHTNPTTSSPLPDPQTFPIPFPPISPPPNPNFSIPTTWTPLAPITGPLLRDDFPDAGILKITPHRYFAYSTNGFPNGVRNNVPIATSANFQLGWHVLEGIDALPDAGAWTNVASEQGDGGVWAPDVNLLDDGTYIMYYAAVPNREFGGPLGSIHCVGAAKALSPLGPFKPMPAPLFCPSGEGEGTNDPDGFRAANGDRYIIYKNGSAENAARQSRIWIQKVSKLDGVTFEGPGKELVVSTEEGDNDTEGPALVANPLGGYTLFYAIGTYTLPDYRIAYKHSYFIEGPYETPERILLQTGVYQGINITAPGAPDFAGGSATEMMFMTDLNGTYPGPRVMNSALLEYVRETGEVKLADPWCKWTEVKAGEEQWLECVSGKPA